VSRIRSVTRRAASPLPGSGEGPSDSQPQRRSRHGHRCPRCHRFGTFAPNSIVCDRCLGALPLVFVTVTVTVARGEGR
jgi:hypothetical protein